jgi:hypothetical protein
MAIAVYKDILKVSPWKSTTFEKNVQSYVTRARPMKVLAKKQKKTNEEVRSIINGHLILNLNVLVTCVGRIDSLNKKDHFRLKKNKKSIFVHQKSKFLFCF